MENVLKEEFDDEIIQQYDLVIEYLKVWEKKFARVKITSISVKTDIKLAKKLEIARSAGYLSAVLAQMEGTKSSIHMIKNGIISEATQFCDDLDFVDGGFYQNTAELLVLNTSCAALMLSERNQSDRARLVLGSALLAIYRFADYCEECYED